MTIASMLSELKRSLVELAGTIVFGMEDGTVPIFGLIFGVAATTTSTHAVLIAGAAGAAAAAVSMMAGAYLDAETSRDEAKANRASLQAHPVPTVASVDALLSNFQAADRLTPQLSAALAGAVRNNPEALEGLMFALQAPSGVQQNPWEQALWMLAADFLSAAVPILPFVFLPIPQARVVRLWSPRACSSFSVSVERGSHNAARSEQSSNRLGRRAAALAGVPSAC